MSYVLITMCHIGTPGQPLCLYPCLGRTHSENFSGAQQSSQDADLEPEAVTFW